MKFFNLKYSFFIFILFTSKKTTAQYQPIRNEDTSAKIYKTVLNFISSSIDTLNFPVFTEIKSPEKKDVYFGTIYTSNFEKVVPAILQNPFFKKILNKDCKNCNEVIVPKKNERVKFIAIEDNKLAKIKLQLTIFPPIRSNGNIAIEVLALSPGYKDDSNGAYLFMLFNENLQLIYFKNYEIIY